MYLLLRSISITLLLTNLLFTGVVAQTCVGTHQLASQADVEEFGAMQCEHLNGSLHILGSVTDLTPLLNLKTISGYLWIAGTEIENLNGLNNLDSVGDYVRLYYNDSLVSLQGLNNLRKVTSYIRIEANNKLESIGALDKLESVFYIFVENNPALLDVGAFSSLRTIRSQLTILNGRFEHIDGFNNLEKVGRIKLGSDALLSVSGFNNLDTAMSLEFYYLPNLQTVTGFTQLNHVPEKISFSICPRVITIPAFNQLTTIGELNIQLDSITTLPNFSSLQKANIIAIGGPLMENSPSFASLATASEIAIGGFAFQSFPAFPALDTVHSLLLSHSQWVEALPNYDHINFIEKFNVNSMTRLKTLNMLNDMPHLKDVIIQVNDSLQSLRIGQSATDMGIVSVSGNSLLTSFEGFDNLKTVDLLDMSYNFILPSIPSFPALTAVRNSLGMIYTGVEEISGFQQLDSIGNDIVTPVCGLYLEDLHNLTRITGFDSLVYVHTFRLWSISNLDTIESFEKLTHINNDCVIDYTTLHSLDFLRQVRHVNENIYFQGNPNLIDVDGLDSIDLWGFSEFIITDNPQLDACNSHWICTSLELGRPHQVKNNATACNSEFDLRQSCDGTYSHIYAEVYYDINQNGIREPEEPLFPTSQIHIFPDSVSVIFGQDNGVTRYIPFGEYRVSSSVMKPENWLLTSAIDTFEVHLTDSLPGDTLHFGYYPVELIRDVRPFQSVYINICNLKSFLGTSALNLGTTVESGILWVALDEHVSDILRDDPDHIDGNFIGYNFEHLFPGHDLLIPIYYTVPSPEVFPLGLPMHFEAYIEFTPSGDTTVHYHNDPIVLCSYDPNDKLTNPSRVNDQTLLTEDLHYTIRFENTGNLEATNITIIDTMDANLDVSTLAVTGSSHANRLETTIQGNIVTFHFRNIYLPYTSWPDSLAKQGFVSFTISPFKPVAENTIIENRAGIYFDLNPPIMTNTARNRFVSEFVSAVAPAPGNNQVSSRIQPNPATNDALLSIETTTVATRRILFFNSLGQQVSQLLSEKTEVALPRKGFEQGMHYYQVWENSSLISIGKFVVQ